ncbi:hypothetical protein BCD58_06500 [Neisseria meningitidis]|nr:hypothetical protein [Neisseria meningitidis]
MREAAALSGDLANMLKREKKRTKRKHTKEEKVGEDKTNNPPSKNNNTNCAPINHWVFNL